MKLLKLARVLMVLALGVGSLAARAEQVSGATPLFAGVPFQSLAGAGGSSINTTQLVWGTSLTVNSLSTGGFGQVNVQLRDIGWPAPLSELTLLVTDLDNIWQRLDGPGSLLINVNGPANLFLAVFARSQDFRTPGLYNLRADFAPVPLPGAIWLLLSGLGGLGVIRRRRARATPVEAALA
jgi:hypothetical protein